MILHQMGCHPMKVMRPHGLLHPPMQGEGWCHPMNACNLLLKAGSCMMGESLHCARTARYF